MLKLRKNKLLLVALEFLFLFFSTASFVYSYNALIQVRNGKVDYKLINNTEIKIYISHIKDPTKVIFLSNYHPGWKVSVLESPTNRWCMEEKYLAKHISNCLGSKKLFDLGIVRLLFGTHLPDSYHQIINNYANSWIIEPAYLKSHYNKSFYQLNSDGSINIELLLYFQPQIIFILTEFVSLITVVFLIGYLLFYYSHKRR